LTCESELHVGRLDPPCDLDVAVRCKVVWLLHSGIGCGHQKVG
jgi:hypothetical protein